MVASGRHKGMLFGEYLDKIGKESWGWKCRPLANFPILIKFIDSKESLSVQVHPDDEYALEKESEYGKNEMWYVLDAEPDSYIYCGFRREVSRDEVEKRIRDNTVTDILNKVPVSRGDIYFIPSGTVHAIGGGILICEIQQSSACTYRLYDYGRKDRFGTGLFGGVLYFCNLYRRRRESFCKGWGCGKYGIPGGREHLPAENGEDISNQRGMRSDRNEGLVV